MGEQIETVPAGVPVRRGTGDLAMPAVTAAQMVAGLEAYRELQKSLDKAMPDQIMDLDGKPFRKKGYWRAISLAFNLTVEMVSEERKVGGFFLDGRENFGWVVSYRATHPMTSRTDSGDGACFAVEKARRFKCLHPEREGSKRTLHFPHSTCPDFDPNFQWRTLPGDATEHNVRSHAHTRAFNRAVSNLVGFGEVSAEEVDRDEHQPGADAAAARPVGSGATPAAQPQPAPPAGQPSAAADGVTTVADVKYKSGTKNNKPWKYADVKFADGRAGRTFDTGLHARAEELKQNAAPCNPDLNKTDKGCDLNGFLPIVKPEPVHEDEPIAGPEKILTVRKVDTDAGPRWIVNTDKRVVVTDQEAHATAATEARAAGHGLLPVVEVLRKEGHQPVNKLLSWGAAPAPAAATGAREPGQEG